MNNTDIPNEHTQAIGAPSRAYGFGNEKIHRAAQAAKKTVVKLLGKVFAQAVPCNFYSSGFVTNTVVQQLVGPNRHRRYLAIQNNGTVDVFIAFGLSPTINGVNSFKMPPNAVYTFESGLVPINDIRCISASASNIAIVEGVEIV